MSTRCWPWRTCASLGLGSRVSWARSLTNALRARELPHLSQAQIEFFQNRLIDSLEQKQRKMARLAGFRIGRRPSESGKSSILGDAKRKKSSTGALAHARLVSAASFGSRTLSIAPRPNARLFTRALPPCRR